MGKPSRHWLQAIAVVLAMALGVPAHAVTADAPFELARLDADPVPARVLAGEFEDRFEPAPVHGVIREDAEGHREDHRDGL